MSSNAGPSAEDLEAVSRMQVAFDKMMIARAAAETPTIVNGSTPQHTPVGANGPLTEANVTGSGSIPNWKGPEPDNSISATNGDPFKKISVHANHNMTLSGAASSFRPAPLKSAPIAFLNRDSEADVSDEPKSAPCIVSSSSALAPIGNVAGAGKGKGKAAQQPIGTRDNNSPTRPSVYFTTDVGPQVTCPGGHYIKVENISPRDIEGSFKQLYDEFQWGEKVRGIITPIPDEDSSTNFLTVYVCFNDIRDADKGIDEAQMVNNKWNASYITQTQFAAIKDRQDRGVSEPTSYHDGQLIFVARFEGLSSEFWVSNLFDKISEVAASYGETVGVREMEADGGNWEFRVEYFKITVAKQVLEAVTKDNPAHIGKWAITAKELPDYVQKAASKAGSAVKGTPQKVVQNGRVHFESPTGRTAWRIDENGQTVPVRAPNRLPKARPGVVNSVGTANHATVANMRSSDPSPRTPVHSFGNVDNGPRSGSWNGPQQVAVWKETPSSSGKPNEYWAAPQTVSIERILAGQDMRSTLMLRNLPPELDSDGLKRVLDVTSKGKYDFVYLRFDFERGTNVGYAFVNFTDALELVAFIEHYKGNPWRPDLKFSPRTGPRIAAFAYATVQGTECLIEKFRNSAIMDENPAFQPRYYYSILTAGEKSQIGTLRPFPDVNNESKHQRSRDNASQIGLFAPSSRRGRGNHSNNRRRSQFDRGTLSQIREDKMFEQYNQNTQMSPLGGPVYYDGNCMTPIGMAPPPQPQFPPVQYASGNVFPNSGPNGFGGVPFTDPFNGGYPVGAPVPANGGAPVYGGPVQRPSPNGHAHVLQEDGTVVYYNNGQNGNANGARRPDGNGYYGPQQ